MKLMREGTDYKIIEDETTPDNYLIKICIKPYADVVYSYTSVRFIEDTQNDCLKINFNYVVKDRRDLENNDDFKNLAFKILTDILYTEKYKIGNDTKP